MWPRKRIDIGNADIAFGLWSCLFDAERSDQEMSDRAGLAPNLLTCFSVRSAFSLLLNVLNLSRGSEVIMTAINVPDMERIVRHHGLVPIPVDLDFDTLVVSPLSIQDKISDRTKMIVIAHLFGSRMPLDSIRQIASTYDIMLVEDCAQVFAGLGNVVATEADVSLYSFGPIKTATALGGALVYSKDSDLVSQMRAVQKCLPVQSRGEFCLRLLKYALLKTLGVPWLYGLLFRCLRNPDRSIGSLARNFAGQQLFGRIHRQPSQPLQTLLRRRLSKFEDAKLAARQLTARRLLSLLREPVCVPGFANLDHTHWVFPVVVMRPDILVEELRNLGFDATRIHSLAVVASTLGFGNCPVAKQILDEVVFVPIREKCSESCLQKIATAINRQRRCPVESNTAELCAP